VIQGVAFKAGDAILTGMGQETWPIAKATFEKTYDAGIARKARHDAGTRAQKLISSMRS